MSLCSIKGRARVRPVCDLLSPLAVDYRLKTCCDGECWVVVGLAVYYAPNLVQYWGIEKGKESVMTNSQFRSLILNSEEETRNNLKEEIRSRLKLEDGNPIVWLVSPPVRSSWLSSNYYSIIH